MDNQLCEWTQAWNPLQTSRNMETQVSFPALLSSFGEAPQNSSLRKTFLLQAVRRTQVRRAQVRQILAPRQPVPELPPVHFAPSRVLRRPLPQVPSRL